MRFMQRRKFVSSIGVLGTAMATGVARPIGANEKVGIALIGARNMGWNDLASAMHTGGAKVVAIADVDKEILERRAGDCEKKFNTKPDLYTDYRKVLERKDVDAVIIGTPDHWHCLQACDACYAGKDVYLEKPIANSIAECDAIVNYAKRYKAVVSVGQQQNSSKMWKRVIEIARSGKLGKIAKVDVWANFRYGAGYAAKADTPPPKSLDYQMWLGPAPEVPYNASKVHGLWRLYWNYGGGLMTDWGVHLLDMVLQGLGKTTTPKKVGGVGGKYAHPETPSQTFDTLSVAFDYGDCCISWGNTATPIGYFDMSYGIAFNGENGILAANREGWKIIPNDSIKGNSVKAESGKPENSEHIDHLVDFLDAVRSRRYKTACTIENGSLCAKLAHLGNIAARSGETIKYDDTAKSFSNPEINAYLKPKYRSPWKFPIL